MKKTLKTKLQTLLVGLGLGALVYQAAAQVTSLGIAGASGQIVLYWPANMTNCILQSTASVSSPNWTTEECPVPVAAVSVGNTEPAQYFRVISTNPPAGMVLIPAGYYTIGDTLDGETDATPATVYVSPFFMDINLVSSNQWVSVYNYALSSGYTFDDSGSAKGTNYPVESVNWYDCVKWCNARSQQAGLTPCYYTDAGFTQVYKTGDVDALYMNRSYSGYRLPTEAEWEKAARGGLVGRRFPWGNLISENQANYYGDNGYSYDFGPNGYNSIGNRGGTGTATTPVGSFDMNAYGLYDMTGNVEEWCWDWYASAPYPAGSPYLAGVNPTGPATGSNRVLRGGSWYVIAYDSRCAFRDFCAPAGIYNVIGFRCVKGL